MVKIYATALLIYLCISHRLQAQVQIPNYNTVINSVCHGYYVYLPQGYDSAATDEYPLIISIHGEGENGDGSASQLPRLLGAGIPKVIDQGAFPNTFTVNGQTFKCIVFSPQFTSWPDPPDVTAILDYAIAHYKVNVNRIYLTGYSMGGGVTWDYAGNSNLNASRLAAIVPVCGASWPDVGRANIIAASNLGVWATHNNQDPVCPLFYTNNYVIFINSAPTPPARPARRSIFTSASHDAWTKTYNPAFTENGMNVYQWMLQFDRTPSILPVSLNEYKAFKTGPSQATISWTTASEINNSHFILERSPDGIDFSSLKTVWASQKESYALTDDRPLKGDNYYRLLQIDKDGKKTYFSILKLNFDPKTKQIFRLSPNPAVKEIQLKFESEENGKLIISIINFAGMITKQWSFSKSAYEWDQVISIKDLPQGSYIIELNGQRFKEAQRFIKN